jgi:hypothetical protein
MDSAGQIFWFANQDFKKNPFSVLGDWDQIGDQTRFCDSLLISLVFLCEQLVNVPDRIITKY